MQTHENILFLHVDENLSQFEDNIRIPNPHELKEGGCFFLPAPPYLLVPPP